MTKHVFISYARKDSDFAKRLTDDLRSKGINAWLDREHIAPGENWEEAIRKALHESGVIVPIVSENSSHSPESIKQLKSIKLTDVSVIPINVDPTLAKQLSDLEPIDAQANYAVALQNLIERLPASLVKDTPIEQQEPISKGYIFISYADDNEEFVADLRDFLESKGYGYWDYQENDRDYHSQLFLELEKIIQDASATLAILSPHWKRSKWAPKEFIFSEEVGTPVFLLMAEQMGPTLITAGIPYIDFTEDRQKGFKKLERALKRKGLT